MEPCEWKVAALCSVVLLVTLVTEGIVCQEGPDGTSEMDQVELNDLILDGQPAWGHERSRLEDEKRAFHAMRGKKEDDALWGGDSSLMEKRAFHAMRGKRLLAPTSVDSFIAQLRRAVLQGKRGSGFFGMRGKRQSDNTPLFYAPRGRRSVDESSSNRHHF
ncbi:uncharacterized protein LOC135384014 [Ornithodoros turicata]|uniref:uncharacterized protein LOC135384014 n=1 Tax=Ornithodoros turicata TaxID=34597 RepID=UPI0031395A8F